MKDKKIIEETVRKIIIASLLEPLPPKQFCTSQAVQVSGSCFEHYLIAGVNSGLVFDEALRHYQTEGAEGIYRYLYLAQRSSFLNRKGGRANQGIIELLFPAALAYLDCGERNASRILGNVSNILKETNKKDVEWLVKTKLYAFKRSHHHKDRKISDVGENIYEHYSKHLSKTTLRKQNLPIYWSYFFNELVNDFPITRDFYARLEKELIAKKQPFSAGVCKAFDAVCKKSNNCTISLDGSHGVLADITALAIFLLLIEHPNYKV